MHINTTPYGQGDSSYQAAGGLDGISRLVEDFYAAMSTLPEAATIRQMHPEDLSLSKQKLCYFLCGWMGGPKLYQEHFGGIHIPGAHSHLPITTEDAEMWLTCMATALERQPYAEDFKDYLMTQFRFPANAIRMACAVDSDAH